MENNIIEISPSTSTAELHEQMRKIRDQKTEVDLATFMKKETQSFPEPIARINKLLDQARQEHLSGRIYNIAQDEWLKNIIKCLDYCEEKEEIKELAAFGLIYPEFSIANVFATAIKEEFPGETNTLFERFNQDECLTLKPTMSPDGTTNIIFLIANDALLRISIGHLLTNKTNINYSLVKFNNCKGKVYDEDIIYRLPIYGEKHQRKETVFGLFDGTKRIGTSYQLDDLLTEYNDTNIKDILKIMSIDDILKRLNEKREVKERRLTR